MHWRDTIVLLGIPIDNLTLAGAVEKIAELAARHRRDGRPRHVATVNVDFLVNTLSWLPDRVRHPELLRILRRADLVTADGMPLVWLSRILGSPLRERVAGADLVPLLARLSAERGLSLYFLGGRGDVAERAAEVLARQYPGVRIAGVDAPFVHTHGPEIADCESSDRPVIERINAASPDILLIGFGNPKQEIWFDRNRARLRAGVSIGIGGTFEFITGRVSRAPLWMQRAGLEWMYRMLQEPRRLLRRYFIGLFKFCFLALPGIAYLTYARARLQKSRPATAGELSSAGTGDPVRPGDAAIIQLPPEVDASYAAGRGAAARDSLLRERHSVLDFSAVRFIDSSGLGFLMSLIRGAEESGGSLAFTGMTAAARHVFEVTKTWDLVSQRSCDPGPQGIQTLPGCAAGTFSWTMSAEGPFAIARFSGVLDASQEGCADPGKLLVAAGPRHLIIDLERLSFCDSSGVALFLKLHRAQSGQGRALVLCGAATTVLQMLRITRLDRLIAHAADLPAARECCLKSGEGLRETARAAHA